MEQTRRFGAGPELLGPAYDYEQATNVWVPPQYVPTIGDDLFPGIPSSLSRAQRSQTIESQRDLVVRLR